MQPLPANPFEVLAIAFCYPEEGQLEILKAGQVLLPEGAAKNALIAFLNKVQSLSLGDWEELHTRTLDLNPLAAPYVGFQTWGESYQRGTFLSNLNRELLALNVDPGGELPDHLIPVLRYLGVCPDPLPELIEVLDPALQRMKAVLHNAEPGNPYVDLIESVHELCKAHMKEEP
jgi:nitrate reductase delta subunit